jgi:hypothetical protein
VAEIKRGGPPVDFFCGVNLIKWYSEISLGVASNLSDRSDVPLSVPISGYLYELTACKNHSRRPQRLLLNSSCDNGNHHH